MTPAEINKLARKAGISNYGLVGWTCWPGQLERFAALVAAAEREECAKVCDFEVARLTAIDEPRPALAVGICATAIRARREK